MIRFDSLGENFRAFRSVHQRCCARRHRRPASNFVATASNLNRFESLLAKSRCRPRAMRGGGGLYRTGSHAQIFFGSGPLIFFSQLKNSNGRAPTASMQGDRCQDVGREVLVDRRFRAPLFGELFSGGEGGSNLWDLRGRDRVGTPR